MLKILVILCLQSEIKDKQEYIYEVRDLDKKSEGVLMCLTKHNDGDTIRFSSITDKDKPTVFNNKNK
jgi:hypothetical protein